MASALPATFEWTEQRTQAAIALAEGKTQAEVAAEAKTTDRTIRNWLSEPEFAEEVDRLSLMVFVANRAERLRIAARVIRSKTSGSVPETDKDLLEWVKYAQSETDGIKLDLSQLAALAATETPVADSGSARTGETVESVH